MIRGPGDGLMPVTRERETPQEVDPWTTLMETIMEVNDQSLASEGCSPDSSMMQLEQEGSPSLGNWLSPFSHEDSPTPPTAPDQDDLDPWAQTCERPSPWSQSLDRPPDPPQESKGRWRRARQKPGKHMMFIVVFGPLQDLSILFLCSMAMWGLW